MQGLKLLIFGVMIVAMVIISDACTPFSGGKNNDYVNHFIVIENMEFQPQDLIINRGDTVTFVNKDIVPHNATEVDSMWASPTLLSGEEWQFIPEKTTHYTCTIHLVMQGTIHVD